MKTLILVRHAKSSWDDPELEDIDRPLNSRGSTDAPRMASYMKSKGLEVDYLVASPANRAFSTAQQFAKAIEMPIGQIELDKDIYHAHPSTLLALLKEMPDRHDSVMMFGHNPGFTDFANQLCKSSIDNIPTCGVVGINFQTDSWSNVRFGLGVLQYFYFPKGI